MSERRRQNFNIKGRDWPAMDERLRQLLAEKRKLTDKQIAEELNKQFPNAIGEQPLRGPDINRRRRDLWEEDQGLRKHQLP